MIIKVASADQFLLLNLYFCFAFFRFSFLPLNGEMFLIAFFIVIEWAGG